MSSPIIVVTPEQLAALVRDAVREALDGSAGNRSDSEWMPCKKAPIPRTTLDNLRKKKIVRSCRVGREVFVHRDDLAKWMEEQSQIARPEVAKVIAMPEPSDPFERASARARARAERKAS